MKKARLEQEMIEKILAWLKDGKDVRKGNWTPKEVSTSHFFSLASAILFMMTKGFLPDLIPALRMPHL
jgi:hypothetical protein